MSDQQLIKLEFISGSGRDREIETAQRFEEFGRVTFTAESDGVTTVFMLAGKSGLSVEQFAALPGVRRADELRSPFPLASRKSRPKSSVISVKGVRIGGGHLAMIAGPCAIEGEALLFEIAEQVKDAGANILRGGAFKPRTSPYSFQGLGEDGLKMLKAAGEQFGMVTVTEIMDPRQVDLVGRYADLFQVGARNMQNFDLLKELGQSGKPVLLKRGMGATVRDLLMSAEYVLSEGNEQVILCERGVRSFEDSTRNMLDLSAVPNVQGQSHLPIIVDPSHATGRTDLIPTMARASIAAGADGVHVEVHQCPSTALSDGPQSLLPGQFAALMDELSLLARFLGKGIDPSPVRRTHVIAPNVGAIQPAFVEIA